MRVLLHESLIAGCRRKLLESLVESLVKELKLGIVHSLVVYLVQSIQLSLKSLVGLVHLHACRRQMDELRMKSESRVRIIWI